MTKPFDGGKQARTITRKHKPLIWECMLGSVYARDPVTKKIEYFDYDYEKARSFAKVDECHDLRVVKAKDHINLSQEHRIKKGQVALWGIH